MHQPALDHTQQYSGQNAFEGGRAREFYGFVALVSTFILWLAYVSWALFPEEWLMAMGIQWYPNREWAILLPAWSVVLVLLTYASYMALALSTTPSFSDLSAITDEYAIIPAVIDGKTENPYSRFALPDSVPEIYDIPIGMVNRVLYFDADDNS